MQHLLYLLFIAGIVGVDQLTKYLVVSTISLGSEVPFLPGFLCFTHVRNTGAAFSSLEGQQWLFALTFVVFTVLILREYFRKKMGFSSLERWCIAAIYAGGLGNMVDRVRLGYVVDMIQTQFMDFPVFNVADCFITCGCIVLMFSLCVLHRDFWKDEKKCS